MSNGKREIALDQIISNLEIASDFYQRTTLTYVVGHNSPLYKVIDASRPKKKQEVVEEEAEVIASDEKMDEEKEEAKEKEEVSEKKE